MAVSRALILEGAIIVADKPVSMFDVLVREEIFDPPRGIQTVSFEASQSGRPG